MSETKNSQDKEVKSSQDKEVKTDVATVEKLDWLDLDLLTDEISRSAYKCVVCHDLVRNPVDISCGHLHCANCLRENKCAFCRKVIDSLPSVSKLFSALVQRCDIKCRNHHLGCTAVYPIGEYSTGDRNHSTGTLKHSRECKFELALCKFCKLETLNVAEHQSTCVLRPLDCKKCDRQYILADMKDHCDTHPDLGCKEYIYCPDGCGKVINKDFTKLHKILYCGKTIIKCLCCEDEVPLTEFKAHLKKMNQKHYEAIFDAVGEMQPLYGKFYKQLPMTTVNIHEELRSRRFCSAAVGGKIYLSQKAWFCDTCWPDRKLIMCEVCKDACHKGHSVVMAQSLNSFCDCAYDCPTGCKLFGDSSILDIKENGKGSVMISFHPTSRPPSYLGSSNPPYLASSPAYLGPSVHTYSLPGMPMAGQYSLY